MNCGKLFARSRFEGGCSNPKPPWNVRAEVGNGCRYFGFAHEKKGGKHVDSAYHAPCFYMMVTQH